MRNFDEFLSLELKAIKDEDFYEHITTVSTPAKRSPFDVFTKWVNQHPYYSAAAASVMLLVVAGAVFWFNLDKTPEYALLKTQQMEVFSADEKRLNNGLGYAEGLPVGELPIQWREASGQIPQLSYIFCDDTLKLYLKEKNAFDSFSGKIQLSYESLSQSYFVNLPNCPPIILKSCLPDPQVLVP
jgi:hypothetical protein